MADKSNVVDWKTQAKITFNVPRPEHFVNYRHCCECAEHEETLASSDVDRIGLEQLGNPAWDPLCFSSIDGLKYYMPALVRITLDTIRVPSENYIDQFVFHLIRDGAGNNLVQACTKEQRQFIADFIEYLIENFSDEIDECALTSIDIFKAHEIWSMPDDL